MNKSISYSILQYKHSLLLGEAINIGVLFYFPEDNYLEFAFGNNARARSIYNDFDAILFNSLINTIKEKLKAQNDLLKSIDLKIGLKEYISNNVLAETESALQFSEPSITRNTFSNNQDAIKFYSERLLPGIITDNPSILRHNESFIIKTYIGYLFKKNRAEIERKLSKNIEIQSEGFSWKFDIGWKTVTNNLVKPIAFDLSDEQGIQSKSAQLYGYLSIFNKYAQNNNCRFDLLVSSPQTKRLFKTYETVLQMLENSDAPKKIVLQDSWEKYSKETVEELLSGN